MLSGLNGTGRHPLLMTTHPHIAGHVHMHVSVCVCICLCACVCVLTYDLFFEKEAGSRKGLG